jgi:hypothetical protein
MFAVYAREANYNDPLASVMVGERPEPIVPEYWVRVRVTHASLNRHDIFTLLGVTAQNERLKTGQYGLRAIGGRPSDRPCELWASPLHPQHGNEMQSVGRGST